MASVLTQRKKSKDNGGFQLSECGTSSPTNGISSAALATTTTTPPEPKFTLPEEILLLGLKDRAGHPSFWNDSLSSGLRGCVLIELALRDRIKLEEAGFRQKDVRKRKVHLKDDAPTGDVILDETIRHIKSSPPCSIENWIEYLNGDSWNPLHLRYQLRNVRERIAKNLVEKGVLTNSKQNYFLFDLKTYPLCDERAKKEVIKTVQGLLLAKWNSDPRQFDKRELALAVMAHVSDVLENALEALNDEDYDVAVSRMSQLVKTDVDAECRKRSDADELLWAVFAVFLK